MVNKNFIVLFIVIIIACIAGFMISESSFVKNNETHSAIVVNGTNGTNGQPWDEVVDLSENYDDGLKHNVTIHHDGEGGISWTDDQGYHTGKEGQPLDW